MITPYGKKTLGGALLVSMILFSLSYVLPPISSLIVSGLAIFILVFTLQFFRDPERKTPQKPNIIISPADGKVVLIKDVSFHDYFQGPVKQVSIFMSPINVHVNRIPISGRVTHYKYIPGQYLMAFDHSSGENNERTEIGIEAQEMKVFFKQISGFVARRIICDARPGDDVEIGKRFGMIRFGSRVDIFVPPTVSLKVSEGQKTTAGETIIGEY